MNIRKLEENDYDLGYLTVLSNLTKIGDISKQKWSEQYQEIISNPSIEIWVIQDTIKNEIVGTATLLIEPKFIHQCGRVGHIEDVVLAKQTHGTGLGKKIVTFLVDIAKQRGCYKVILDCSEQTAGFYEKCGFTTKGKQMGLYF